MFVYVFCNFVLLFIPQKKTLLCQALAKKSFKDNFNKVLGMSGEFDDGKPVVLNLLDGVEEVNKLHRFMYKATDMQLVAL